MAPHAKLALAAKLLTPYRQGDLDGLCGLYSIINAVRLAVHPTRPLHRPQVRPLFITGLATLGRQRHLRYALASGMFEDTWRRVLASVLSEANKRLDGDLTATWICADMKTLDARAMIRRVAWSIRRGYPVLITLGGRYNHWTVVTGYSTTQFELFDSSGYQWVQLRSIGADCVRSSKPHLISPDTIVALKFEHGKSKSDLNTRRLESGPLQ